LSWANPYFGVEIEAEAPQDRGTGTRLIVEAMPPDLFAVKSDGSLSHGAEFVSQPMTLRYAQAIDWSPFDQLRQQGWRAWDTPTAGFHVHVSRIAFHIPTGYIATGVSVQRPQYSRRQQQWLDRTREIIAATVRRRDRETAVLAEYRREDLAEYRREDLARYMVTGVMETMETHRRIRTSLNRELRQQRNRLEQGPPTGYGYTVEDDCIPANPVSLQSDAHLFRFGHLILSSPTFFQRLAGRDSAQWANFGAQPKRDFKGRALKVRGNVFGRYVPVNLCNRNTVEIRIFRGTIRPRRILANLELVAGMVEYTRNLRTGDVASGALQYRELVSWLMARSPEYPHICELLDDSDNKKRLRLTGVLLGASSLVTGYETKETVECVS
jgi:hypothetical protein